MLWLIFIAAFLYLAALAALAGGLLRPSGSSQPGAYRPERALPLSVVVAARNEAANLPGLLAALQAQDYPGAYEVVLVLDRCTDDSEALARAHTVRDPRLRVLSIAATPPDWSPKKWALEQGIAAAKHPHLAFTDADCLPETGWLSGIAQQFGAGRALVLGIGRYARQPGPLNAFIQFETHVTAVQYLGLAAWGMPYMGVGRNLAYSKAFFARAGGFADIAHRLSGDDDLLVNHHARGPETGIMLPPETHTLSLPKTTFSAWWAQKMRHLSAGTAYRPATQLILSAFHGLQAIFYLSLTVALISGQPWVPVVLLYTGRTILAAILWNLKKGFRWNWQLFLAFPLLDLAYLLYHLIMVPASLVLKPKWQGK